MTSPKNIEIIKQKRELYRQQKLAGETQQRRLAFFVTAIKTLGLSYRQVQEMTGYSVQRMSWWITQDETYLSSIIDLFSKLNICVTCKIIRPAEQPKTTIPEDINFSIIIDPKIIVPQNVKRNKDLDEKCQNIMEKTIKENGRLKFLAEFITENSIYITSFCEKTGTKYATIWRIFGVDDIKISRLNSIAEAYGAQLQWSFRNFTAEEKINLKKPSGTKGSILDA